MAELEQPILIPVNDKHGAVTGVYVRPRGAKWLMILAHGAGADMRHPFMVELASRLANRKIATLRFQFPYAEKGKKAPDSPKTLQLAIEAACRTGAEVARGLPLLVGGKSMGGRMASLLAVEGKMLQDVKGLVFFGFPLHAAGKPSDERGKHLRDIKLDMLFLQGTRDRLADLSLLKPLLKNKRKARLHVIEHADHGFHIPKATGRTDADILDELADTTAEWASKLPVTNA